MLLKGTFCCHFPEDKEEEATFFKDHPHSEHFLPDLPSETTHPVEELHQDSLRQKEIYGHKKYKGGISYYYLLLSSYYKPGPTSEAPLTI